MKQKIIDFLTLFTSASTLICCALPALLVSLGAGATLVGLLTSLPQLIWVSQHKAPIFILGLILLILGGLLQRSQISAPCPIDPDLRSSCLRTRRNSLRMYYLSILTYFTGVFFAFILPWLMG